MTKPRVDWGILKFLLARQSYKILQFIWPTWSYPFWIIFSKAARKCFAQRSWSSASRSVTSCNTPSLDIIMIMDLEHIISIVFTNILFLQFCIMHVQECYHIFSTCIQIPYPYYIAWTFISYTSYLVLCMFRGHSLGSVQLWPGPYLNQQVGLFFFCLCYWLKKKLA